MKYFENTTDFFCDGPSAVTLGKFDGLHRGHQKLIRKITELKKEDRSTELYSLAEIRNIRKDDNFGKGYISGRYGAIPMLNIDFANIVSKM